MSGGSSVLSAQVIFETWRAADCRPYMHAGGWYRSTAQVVFGALHGDESSPLHCVVPFNRTGYIRYVPRNGTQAVPYGFAGGWFHSTAQVVFETWRAADCRPYGHGGGWCRSTALVLFATFLGDGSSPLHCVVPFERCLRNTFRVECCGLDISKKSDKMNPVRKVQKNKRN